MFYNIERSKHFICLYPQTKITLQVVYNEGVKIISICYIGLGIEFNFFFLFTQTQTGGFLYWPILLYGHCFLLLNKQTHKTLLLFIERYWRYLGLSFLFCEKTFLDVCTFIQHGYHVVVTSNLKVQLLL